VKNRISLLMVVALFLSGCSSSPSVTPESYGARAGEDGAKYWKQQNPGQVASSESAGAYCASMAEDGGKQYGWTINEILQASDSCGIWFTTEMFRK
jgi:PBP1b-binding outer membrane lipoprotein LpoB